MSRSWRWIACLLLAPWASPALAHKPSDSYLTLSADSAGAAGQWDIALRDLDFAIGLDADGDGAITWGETRARHADIAAYAMARLSVAADGGGCPLSVTEHLIDTHSDGAYAVMRFTAACRAQPAALTVTYRLFADIDPQHKGLLFLKTGDTAQTAIFSPETARQTLGLARPDAWRQLADYLAAGVEHIWNGYDHILFLLSLLLPAVAAPAGRAWEGREGFRAAFLDVLKIVTAFTLAHSITLALASLRIVELPARLSESAIALSVAIAALNNLHPLVHARRWAAAFGFGLVHGFGFASVLVDLGLPEGALALALAGFNLGVETGQMVIVGLFLPLAYGLRRTWLYRNAVMVGGSWAIALTAAVWFIERSLNVSLLPIH